LGFDIFWRLFFGFFSLLREVLNSPLRKWSRDVGIFSESVGYERRETDEGMRFPVPVFLQVPGFLWGPGSRAVVEIWWRSDRKGTE